MKYNPNIHYLGILCKRNHNWNNENKSLRYICCHGCVYCNQSHKFSGKKPKIYPRKKDWVICINCGKSFLKAVSYIKHSPNHCCSHKCSMQVARQSNLKGNRVSKLELIIQNILINRYPNLEFHYNRADTIGSELDIYIPSLKLAFELNGPTHYEPIFGQDNLEKVQINDCKKYHACTKSKIDLCIIDISSIKYCIPERYQWVLDTIFNIIDTRS